MVRHSLTLVMLVIAGLGCPGKDRPPPQPRDSVIVTPHVDSAVRDTMSPDSVIPLDTLIKDSLKVVSTQFTAATCGVNNPDTIPLGPDEPYTCPPQDPVRAEGYSPRWRAHIILFADSGRMCRTAMYEELRIVIPPKVYCLWTKAQKDS